MAFLETSSLFTNSFCPHSDACCQSTVPYLVNQEYFCVSFQIQILLCHFFLVKTISMVASACLRVNPVNMLSKHTIGCERNPKALRNIIVLVTLANWNLPIRIIKDFSTLLPPNQSSSFFAYSRFCLFRLRAVICVFVVLTFVTL